MTPTRIPADGQYLKPAVPSQGIYPPSGGASIAFGYTPTALAGAEPRKPPAPKGG